MGVFTYALLAYAAMAIMSLAVVAIIVVINKRFTSSEEE